MTAQGSNTGPGAGVKTVLGALGKFMKGLKDYNIFELLKILFTILVLAFIISFVRNPDSYIDKVVNIRWYLNELRDLTGADRAWTLEPHNGGSNSTTGMNFYYLNLMGDEPAEGYPHLNKEEFKDIPFSEYPMANYIDKEGYWWGPLS